MIQERLFALRDEKYREFQRSLIPGLPRENIIGIRIPFILFGMMEFIYDFPEPFTSGHEKAGKGICERAGGGCVFETASPYLLR